MHKVPAVETHVHGTLRGLCKRMKAPSLKVPQMLNMMVNHTNRGEEGLINA